MLYEGHTDLRPPGLGDDQQIEWQLEMFGRPPDVHSYLPRLLHCTALRW